MRKDLPVNPPWGKDSYREKVGEQKYRKALDTGGCQTTAVKHVTHSFGFWCL